jgi:hypothetical protein
MIIQPAILIHVIRRILAWLQGHGGRVAYRAPGVPNVHQAEADLNLLEEAVARAAQVGRVARPERASRVPADTLDTFRAPYAGDSLTAALQASRPFLGDTASLLPNLLAATRT